MEQASSVARELTRGLSSSEVVGVTCVKVARNQTSRNSLSPQEQHTLSCSSDKVVDNLLSLSVSGGVIVDKAPLKEQPTLSRSSDKVPL